MLFHDSRHTQPARSLISQTNQKRLCLKDDHQEGWRTKDRRSKTEDTATRLRSLLLGTAVGIGMFSGAGGVAFSFQNESVCDGGSCPLRVGNIFPKGGEALGRSAFSEKRLRSATVRVINGHPAGGNPAACFIGVEKGSGVCLENRRGEMFVLTAAHIFQDGVGVVMIQTGDGKRIRAQIVLIDPFWDIALAAPAERFETEIVQIADRTPRVGDRSFIAGFGSDDHFKITAGNVIGYTMTSRQSNYETLRTTGAVRKGDSGGPVVDDENRLIGIVWGTDGESSYATWNGRIKKILAENRYLAFADETDSVADDIEGPADDVENGSMPNERRFADENIPEENFLEEGKISDSEKVSGENRVPLLSEDRHGNDRHREAELMDGSNDKNLAEKESENQLIDRSENPSWNQNENRTGNRAENQTENRTESQAKVSEEGVAEGTESSQSPKEKGAFVDRLLSIPGLLSLTGVSAAPLYFLFSSLVRRIGKKRKRRKFSDCGAEPKIGVNNTLEKETDSPPKSESDNRPERGKNSVSIIDQNNEFAQELNDLYDLNGRNSVADATCGRLYDIELEGAEKSSDPVIASYAQTIRRKIKDELIRIHSAVSSPGS